MRKFILSLLGLVFIVGSYFASEAIIRNNQKERPKPKKLIKTVFVDTVVNGTVAIEILAQGNLVAQKRLELYSEVQGILKASSKLFKPGQAYKKGQTLLSLDASEFYASVQSQKSALYNQLTAIMPDLRLDYPGAFTKWQAYLNSFDIDKAILPLPDFTSEREGYFITGNNIQSSYFNIKNLEQRLGKYQIKAPFSGILTEALVTEGTLVRVGQKLGEFIDTTNYELEVAISKTYADLLAVGNKVTLLAGDQTTVYTGKVIRVNGNIDQASQTINAYIAVKGEGLREGVFLEAVLKAKEEQEAISIPRELLQPNNQLFTLRDSILDIIDVNPVYFSEKQVVIKGIPNGTKIISRPVPGAYVGMLVKVYQEKDSLQDQAK